MEPKLKNNIDNYVKYSIYQYLETTQDEKSKYD